MISLKNTEGISTHPEIASSLVLLEKNGHSKLLTKSKTSMQTINKYIIEGSREDLIEIYSPPATATFLKGGLNKPIPLGDLLKMLYEWKDYLEK